MGEWLFNSWTVRAGARHRLSVACHARRDRYRMKGGWLSFHDREATSMLPFIWGQGRAPIQWQGVRLGRRTHVCTYAEDVSGTKTLYGQDNANTFININTRTRNIRQCRPHDRQMYAREYAWQDIIWHTAAHWLQQASVSCAVVITGKSIKFNVIKQTQEPIFMHTGCIFYIKHQKTALILTFFGK